MMPHTTHARKAMALAAVLSLAACDDQDPMTLSAPAVVAPASIRLDVSAVGAAPGERVGVAVATEDVGLLGLQGYVRFDPASLRYLGQVVEGAGLVMVNDAQAGSGELRVMSVNTNGLRGRTAMLVFEVRATGYAGRLRYEFEEAATRDAAVRTARVSDRIVAAPYMAVGEPRRMSPQDWIEVLASQESAQDRAILMTPGQYRLDLRYGDANLSGSVTVSDVVYLGGVSVGNTALIDNTSRDAVIAGNAFPFNSPGLGEPSDPLRPGVEGNSNSPGGITVSDVTQVSLESVGIDRAVVGELIPGRGPLAAGRVVVPAGYIVTNTTWTKGNVYELAGIVRVDSGATLTIEPGTRVEGQSTLVSALFIHRNGRIVADGTALEPIVFTCTAATKAKGCWGGLVIAGYAPLNTGTTGAPLARGDTTTSPACLQNQGEGGAPIYGGCSASDSSGVLRYVRSEYAGFILSPNNELNGITLNGVGSGTVVEHIQVHAGLDDGLELFGGTVNLKWVYLTANSDDSFDFSDGWSGKAQFFVIQHDSLDSDKGIEADNAAANLDATPRTIPQLWNFTFVGKRDPAGTGGPAANNSEDALHIRKGTRPKMFNFVVHRFTVGLDIDDATTCTNINTELELERSVFSGILNLGNTDADPACGSYTTPNVESQFIQDAANTNTVITDSAAVANLMINPLEVIAPDFRMNASQIGGTPPSDGFFDVSATYVGAVPPANAARSNIPWYAGWTRGWQSATTP